MDRSGNVFYTAIGNFRVRKAGRCAAPTSLNVGVFKGPTTLPPPSLELDVQEVQFDSVETRRPSTRTVRISNVGGSSLRIDSDRIDRTDIAVSVAGSLVFPGEFVTLTLEVKAQDEGEISARLDIFTSDPTRSAVSLRIRGVVVIIPGDPRADFNDDGEISLADFIAFALAYNSADALNDLNGNGSVDFGDFVLSFRRSDER